MSLNTRLEFEWHAHYSTVPSGGPRKIYLLERKALNLSTASWSRVTATVFLHPSLDVLQFLASVAFFNNRDGIIALYRGWLDAGNFLNCTGQVLSFCKFASSSIAPIKCIYYALCFIKVAFSACEKGMLLRASNIYRGRIIVESAWMDRWKRVEILIKVFESVGVEVEH